MSSREDWCGPDKCPARICGGPHVLYVDDHGNQALVPPGLPPPSGYRLPGRQEPDDC